MTPQGRRPGPKCPPLPGLKVAKAQGGCESGRGRDAGGLEGGVGGPSQAPRPSPGSQLPPGPPPPSFYAALVQVRERVPAAVLREGSVGGGGGREVGRSRSGLGFRQPPGPSQDCRPGQKCTEQQPRAPPGRRGCRHLGCLPLESHRKEVVMVGKLGPWLTGPLVPSGSEGSGRSRSCRSDTQSLPSAPTKPRGPWSCPGQCCGRGA